MSEMLLLQCRERKKGPRLRQAYGATRAASGHDRAINISPLPTSPVSPFRLRPTSPFNYVGRVSFVGQDAALIGYGIDLDAYLRLSAIEFSSLFCVFCAFSRLFRFSRPVGLASEATLHGSLAITPFSTHPVESLRNDWLVRDRLAVQGTKIGLADSLQARPIHLPEFL